MGRSQTQGDDDGGPRCFNEEMPAQMVISS